MGVRAPRHGHRLRKGYSIRSCQVGCVIQCGGAATACYELVLFNVGLQHLLDSRSVLYQSKLVQPRLKVVRAVEVKSQGKRYLEEAWCPNDGFLDTQPPGRVIKCVMECCELLALGVFLQNLPHGWERCVICHLAQAEEVGQVFPQEIRYSLTLNTLYHASLILLGSYHLHQHILYVCCYQQPLHAL